MIRRYYAIILIIAILILSGCTDHDRKMEKVINDSTSEVLSYFEQNTDFLTQLSKKFLQILSARSDLDTIQVYVGKNRLDGFSEEVGHTILDHVVYQELEDDLKVLEDNPPHISIVYATAKSNNYSSRSCEYIIPVWDGEIPYHVIELVYCEDKTTEVHNPEFIKQIDDNWYLENHYLPSVFNPQ